MGGVALALGDDFGVVTEPSQVVGARGEGVSGGRLGLLLGGRTLERGVWASTDEPPVVDGSMADGKRGGVMGSAASSPCSPLGVASTEGSLTLIDSSPCTMTAAVVSCRCSCSCCCCWISSKCCCSSAAASRAARSSASSRSACSRRAFCAAACSFTFASAASSRTTHWG